MSDNVSMPDPPAANQDKDEPIATTPSEPPQSDNSTAGDSKGVAVPSVQAAAGSSEESGAIEDIRTTSLAPPGKPDGEVDTRA